MQSCVLFVLSLSIQESTGWASWPSWPSKPSQGNGGKRNKCKNPVVPLSKCLLTPNHLSCTVSSYNGYPDSEIGPTEFYRTNFTNLSVIKPVYPSAPEIDYRCTGCTEGEIIQVQPTLEICAVYDIEQPTNGDQCKTAGEPDAPGNSCGVHV